MIEEPLTNGYTSMSSVFALTKTKLIKSDLGRSCLISEKNVKICEVKDFVANN